MVGVETYLTSKLTKRTGRETILNDLTEIELHKQDWREDGDSGMMLVIVHLVLSRTVMSFILPILTAPYWPFREGALGIRVKLVPYIDVYIAEHPSWATQSLPL